ncbi:ExeM/NucH family extracellular endonuclease [Lewinella sp. 4G2]|uniref:ExeM/NucH family extracellular endonuclease n=1 Tax=Lewinella sp. 4G2 TaxID=1803372 RepID=UPI0007B4C251|nr:ExeM/NucH family extracellular endonuclease [Lewinella sp. 4G2]OAV45382.1 hypothetical protein A3850_013160 [Lewinella sp. 4G2]
MRSLYLLLAFFASTSLFAQEVIITGILDGGLSGGIPRAVEIYVNGTVDLDGYRLERYSNSSTSVEDFTALTGTYTDEFVYIINSSHFAEFDQAFGNSGDFANRISGTNIFGNGNDAFTITQGSGIIDQTGGEIGESDNLYRDSYLYRVNSTGPDGGWVADNWALGGNDLLDGVAIGDYAGIVPFGSYTTTPPGPSISVMAGDNVAEPATDGSFIVTLSESVAGDVTVTYALAGSATAGSDYTDTGMGSVLIAGGTTSATIVMSALDDSDPEFTETIEITLTSTDDDFFTVGGSATIEVLDDEPVSAIAISAIQGSGMASAVTGQEVTVQAVVVGDFQGGTGVGLGGFFVMEEDADQDGDLATSEGIWIFYSGTTDVNEGDLVTVTGQVEEDRGLTQINANITNGEVTIDATAQALPTPASLDLPLADEAAFEAFEGMLVTLVDDAYVTNNFSLGQFGEFEISVDERLIQFTECNEPDPSALGPYNDAQDLRRLIVDDGRTGTYTFPIILPDGTELTPTNTLRAGDRFTGLTGVMDERFTGYRLQPTDPGTIVENERPTSAPDVGGNLTVVGMNVLNYFTTLGQRGADNAQEFDRQEAKIVAAICELDADIIGLVEIENNGFGPNGATQTLIDAINASCSKQYTAVISPNTGGDEIKVVLIYDASVVEESGTAASLSQPAAVFQRNRVPVAQTFRIIEVGNDGFGGEITVTANHFKSKGGSCGAGDDDDGGAGSCDGSRQAAAAALRDWLATNPTGSTTSNILVIGDLNAYSEEVPITSFADAGYVNLVPALAPAGSFPCSGLPSYVFRGEWGSLDHAIASADLASMVTGAVPWEVNASEPTALDYDTEDNNPALYADDFYRFSDHNPIVVGIQLLGTLPAQLGSFTGEERNGDVDLTWTTLSEMNTARFEIERRSADGSFLKIGEVAAAGTSSAEITYNFTDPDPLVGTNAYRLQTVDQDDQRSFSNVITVEVEDPNSIEVYQTEAGIYRLADAPVGTTWLITDAGGAVVRTGRTSYQRTDVDGRGLPPGAYFMALTLPDGKGKVFKLIFN